MRKSLDRYRYDMYLCREIGIVTRNIDQDQDGEIVVSSPTSGYEYIDSMGTDSGFFSPMTVGDLVLVEALDGDPNYLVASGCFRGGTIGNKDIPACFKREVPTNRGWVTPGDLMTNSEAAAADSVQGTPVTVFGGHKFELDDGKHTYVLADDTISTRTKEEKGIRFTSSAGNKIHIYEEDTDGSSRNYIKLESISGQHITIDEDTSTITLETTGNAKIIIDATGKVQIQAANVEIGDASLEKILKGETFLALWNLLLTTLSTATAGGNPLDVTTTTWLTSTYLSGAGGQLANTDDVFSQKHKVE